MDITQTHCSPTFCHEYAISRLKSEGYKLAVCSNSIRDTMTSMLSKAALINYFDFYLSNQDVKKSKPDPEIYVTAMKRFGVLPVECLVLEDNANGIRAAKDAGSHVMEIYQTSDVNYQNIIQHINKIESSPC